MYSQEKESNPSTKKANDSTTLHQLTTDENALQIKSDSLVNDSIPKKKGAIEDIIDHDAEGYAKINRKKNLITLFDKAITKYQDIELEAGQIFIDYKNNLVTATGIKDDSLGYTQLPVFKQGGEESVQDTIIFNFKTKKALIYGLKTTQNDIITYGEVTKRENDSTIFVNGVRFTTSKKRNPDYYLATNKAKIVPGKKIIIGSTVLYIKDVPTPLVLPFGYIPLSKDRSSGFIIPSFGDSNEQGFFLQNAGYYLALSDYYDLALFADIYSNGSWGFKAESNYALRYRFNGAFNFKYENIVTSLKGFDDYGIRTNYNIRWNHNQDPKANPNARLSASVNLGSSRYYQESLNEYNNNNFLNNSLNSSVSYSQKIVGTPFNVSTTATLSQNTQTELINLSLPSLQVSMDRIFPFAPKSGAKKNAFHNIGVNYNLGADYRISTSDEFLFKSQMFENAQAGVQHTTSASTNIKMLKYFTLTPNVSYKDVWYFDSVKETYDPIGQEVIKDTIPGFVRFNDYSASAALSTTVYGRVDFKKGKIKAIRHVARPSVSFTYRPDFSHYFDEVLTEDGQDPMVDLEEYSKYQAGFYGQPSRGLQNTVGFSINNTLEAKVQNKDSTATEDKKITLLNALNISTSYNIAADTLKWSPLSVNAGTTLFNNKLSINTNATFDPYAIDANGGRINKFNKDLNGSLFRLTNAALTMNYSISSDSFKEKPKKKTGYDDSNFTYTSSLDQNQGVFGENLNVSNDLREDDEDDEEKSSKLYNSSIPWTLQLAYSLQYSNNSRQDEFTANSVMFTGDVELTPKWKVGISSGFDLKEKGFTYTQMRFTRDLDSWIMNFNWVPFGTRKTYYFFIGVKSSALADLKYDKYSLPDQRLY